LGADSLRLDEPIDCAEPTGSCNGCPLRKDCTDRELAAACKRGLKQARRHLYETYQQRILSLMMRMTGNPEDASDLVQDAFVRVLDRIGDYRGESALGTWIHRVAINEALQHLRRKRRYQRITGSIAENSRHFEPEPHDPTESLAVQEALGRLPDRMRQMVMLRYQDGLDYSEIAETLGVKQGTVASGLNRARQQLREILQ
jgi:RNA polymerase sigma-70 factor (ECF subfamily)